MRDLSGTSISMEALAKTLSSSSPQDPELLISRTEFSRGLTDLVEKEKKERE